MTLKELTLDIDKQMKRANRLIRRANRLSFYGLFLKLWSDETMGGKND